MDSNNTNSTNKYIGRKQAGNNVLYAELSYKLMAAVFEVHNQLGPGFTENIIENSRTMRHSVPSVIARNIREIRAIRLYS